MSTTETSTTTNVNTIDVGPNTASRHRMSATLTLGWWYVTLTTCLLSSLLSSVLQFVGCENGGR